MVPDSPLRARLRRAPDAGTRSRPTGGMKMTGERYRRARRLLGLTQRKLAEHLGVHPQTISDRERGKNPLTREAWLAITNNEIRVQDDESG